MTTELVFLMVGYGVIWVVLFGYLVFITSRIHSVRNAINDLRHELNADRDQEPS
jgi:CcmD family protein